VLQGRGLVHYARRDFTSAIADFELYFRSYPSSYHSYRSLALVYEQLNAHDRALAAYDGAIKLQEDVYNYVGKARVLLAKGELKAALQQAEIALALNPKFAGGLIARSYIKHKLGQSDEALADMGLAIELAPLSAYGYTARAGLQLKQGNGRAAWRDTIEAMRLDATDPAVLNMRAWVLAVAPDAGDRNPAKAIELALQACKILADRHPGYLDTLACAYAADGKYTDAITAVKKALVLREQLYANGNETEARLKLFEQGKPFIEGSDIKR